MIPHTSPLTGRPEVYIMITLEKTEGVATYFDTYSHFLISATCHYQRMGYVNVIFKTQLRHLSEESIKLTVFSFSFFQ